MNNYRHTILIMLVFVFVSCGSESNSDSKPNISKEGIKINENVIKEIASVMNRYMVENGDFPDDIYMLEDYYAIPKESEYIITIDDYDKTIILTNLLYDIVSTYQIETQVFEHTKK